MKSLSHEIEIHNKASNGKQRLNLKTVSRVKICKETPSSPQGVGSLYSYFGKDKWSCGMKYKKIIYRSQKTQLNICNRVDVFFVLIFIVK